VLVQCKDSCIGVFWIIKTQKKVRPMTAERRVLLIYDKAGIDWDYWKRCRQESAVYFLSRAKENQVHPRSVSLE